MGREEDDFIDIGGIRLEIKKKKEEDSSSDK